MQIQTRARYQPPNAGALCPAHWGRLPAPSVYHCMGTIVRRLVSRSVKKVPALSGGCSSHRRPFSINCRRNAGDYLPLTVARRCRRHGAHASRQGGRMGMRHLFRNHSVNTGLATPSPFRASVVEIDFSVNGAASASPYGGSSRIRL